MYWYERMGVIGVPQFCGAANETDHGGGPGARFAVGVHVIHSHVGAHAVGIRWGVKLVLPWFVHKIALCGDGVRNRKPPGSRLEQCQPGLEGVEVGRHWDARGEILRGQFDRERLLGQALVHHVEGVKQRIGRAGVGMARSWVLAASGVAIGRGRARHHEPVAFLRFSIVVERRRKRSGARLAMWPTTRDRIAVDSWLVDVVVDQDVELFEIGRFGGR